VIFRRAHTRGAVAINPTLKLTLVPQSAGSFPYVAPFTRPH
jgi:hypothetical protein